jgi:hypothetical protein
MALVASLPSFTSFSQSSTSVRGTIIDALTRKPIPIVNVIVTNTPYGAATDSAGFFEIHNLSPDLYVLEFRHVAYHKRFHVLSLKPAQQVTFSIELSEEPVNLEGVQVISTPGPTEKSNQTYARAVITAREMENIGATKLTDILQTFQPGAVLNPLARRRAVMGSNPSWVPYLIYLDGAYVQYIPGTLDNIVDVRQIEKIEVARWVGVAPNIGPGTSERVIYITTKKPKR